MTHVFIFNNASRGAGYGVGTYVSQLSKGLAQSAGLAVSVVEMFADIEDFRVERDSKGVLHYKIPSVSEDGEGDTYNRCVYYYLVRNIHVGKDEAIVFQFNYFQHVLLAWLLKAHFWNCRIVLTVHYFAWSFGLSGNLERFRSLVSSGAEFLEGEERKILGSFRAERAFLRLADEVIVLSKFAKGVLVDDYRISADKIHLVYNGLGEPCADSFGGERPAMSPRNIVFVGRLDEIKGVGYLIQAFKEVAEIFDDLRLLIAGDGDIPCYLRQCLGIESKVSFLGKLGVEELEEVYRKAYIGVLPSFHEQCSYTVIEMMRHGIPVVGTDSTGLSEMLDCTPFLRVRIGDGDFSPATLSSQIAARLELLLGGKEVYVEAACAVRKSYMERYTIKKMLDGTKGVFNASLMHRDNMVSSDYLLQMDSRLVALVNSQPDMDVDFSGISGIGVYLWYRVSNVLGRMEEHQSALLQEHLVYLLEWLGERLLPAEAMPVEMSAVLRDMLDKNFLVRMVREAIDAQGDSKDCLLPRKEEVLHNALKICNYKI